MILVSQNRKNIYKTLPVLNDLVKSYKITLSSKKYCFQRKISNSMQDTPFNSLRKQVLDFNNF